MAEYWKSTERYWCKHCACYVRDTKLERQNHEATARHQGALKRFLRDLHRGHEQEERNKERARQEIERLNGVTSGSTSGARAPGYSAAPAPKPGAPSEGDLKKQREQLAQMGVQMPDTFRPEMAMPGEWTVTNTRVIETKTEEEETKAKATGVRKREITEEDKEEEDAVRGLYKKPKRWGRDSKITSQAGDADLDALLSGTLNTAKQEEDADAGVKKEEELEPQVKKEEDDGEAVPDSSVTPAGIKPEPEEAGYGLDEPVKQEADAANDSKPTEAEAPVGGVVFKKRKAKNIRQR
ncbi:u1 zinc finger domain-containing protein [Sarocladium implicatum]|nr:u1 zinc finger domain-containing protein [Sarocladium implicatum]